MYREPLGPGVDAALDAARGRPAAVASSGTAPSPGSGGTTGPRRRWPAAFGGALAELLAPSGIVCFDSTHPAAKRAAAPLIVRALEQARGARRRPRPPGRGTRRGERGRPGSRVGDGATLVMLEGTQGRDRLVASDGGVRHPARAGSGSRSTSSRRIAASEPTRLSPNVLLRPVVESALLPTVAYVGGPGELRYLALTPPVYQRLGVDRQRPMPRWSGVLVEPRVDRVLEKFGVDARRAARARRARSRRGWCGPSCPPRRWRRSHAIRAALEAGLRRAGAQRASEIDPTLARPMQGARHQALAGTQEVEKKLVQHLKRRQETELGQIARARDRRAPRRQAAGAGPDRWPRSSRAMGRRWSPTSRDAHRGMVRGRP